MDDALLRRLTSQIVSLADPEQVVLFGSHARGDSRPDSDVDLLVVQQTELPTTQRAMPLYVGLRGYGVSKDIVVYTPAEVDDRRGLPGSLVMTALREGRVLYERQSGLCV